MTADVFVNEVVVLADDSYDQNTVTLGLELGELLDLPWRRVHVDSEPADLVGSIIDELRPKSLVVMASKHENRWSGKHSIAEHLADTWGGVSVLAGLSCTDLPLQDRVGPVLVALDGSPFAERSIGPATAVATSLGREVLLTTVVSVDNDDNEAIGASEALEYLSALGGNTQTCVLTSNDPISALRSEAERLGCVMVVVTSKGDRSTPRPTISRTCSGLVGEAAQPVMIVGPNWG